ncbi:MAG: hypothetical protein AB7Q97_06295 [Gammaproteobacteria bacterium]
MYKKLSLAAMFAAAMFVTGCANDKEPATKVLADAEAAYAAIHDEAAKYVPSNIYGAESVLKELKDAMTRGDYKSVIEKGPMAMNTIAALKAAATKRKADMEAQAAAALENARKDWEVLSTDVPKWIDAIQTRVSNVVKSKLMPPGVTKEEFEGVKAGLETMKTTWAEASAAFEANPVEAATKGRAVIDKGNELMGILEKPAATPAKK